MRQLRNLALLQLADICTSQARLSRRCAASRTVGACAMIFACGSKPRDESLHVTSDDDILTVGLQFLKEDCTTPSKRRRR